jgi:hypothetical protein
MQQDIAVKLQIEYQIFVDSLSFRLEKTKVFD